MGFQDLFKAWRGEGILSQTLDEFTKMIDLTHWMFQAATGALWVDPDGGQKKKQIRERDIEVNKTERSIRKKIVQHLANYVRQPAQLDLSHVLGELIRQVVEKWEARSATAATLPS